MEVESTNGQKFYIDKTTGNVGIGTNSPAAKLHIKGLIYTDTDGSATEGGEIRFSDATGGKLWGIDNSGKANGSFLRFVNYSTGTVPIKIDTNNVTSLLNFKLANGTQGAGKVLTSDANGLASWATASAGSVPQMSLTSPTAPAGTTVGQLAYNTNANSGLPVGLAYWDGSKWVPTGSNSTQGGYLGSSSYTGTYNCPFTGSASEVYVPAGIQLAVPSDGWYTVQMGLSIRSDCNDYHFVLFNTVTGVLSPNIYDVYCVTNASVINYMTPRDQSRMVYLYKGNYILQGKKTNSIVPASCNEGNPNFYLNIAKITN